MTFIATRSISRALHFVHEFGVTAQCSRRSPSCIAAENGNGGREEGRIKENGGKQRKNIPIINY